LVADDGDVLVALAGVPPHVLVDPDHGDAVEPVRTSDQDPLAFGEDRVVRGVPRDPEALGDAGDGQVLTDDPGQRPAQPAAGELGSWLGGLAGVLAPHVPAAGASVAADRDQQRCWPPAQRLVRQLAGHAVARLALTPALTTPPVGLQDPAGQHRPTRLEVLPDHLQTKVVEAAERRQIRAAEYSVRHVEVFLEERVGTLIFRRPRRLPPDRHAHPDYTLICEEPGNHSRR